MIFGRDTVSLSWPSRPAALAVCWRALGRPSRVATGDYGIFHLTGRRSWLRLREREEGQIVTTELIFVGERGATTNESLRAHFDRTLEDVRRRGDEGYIMNDLRAFDVVFA